MPDNVTNTNRPLKNNIPLWFTYGSLGLILMLLGMLGVIFTKPAAGLLCFNAISGKSNRLFHLDTHTSRYLLKCGIPFLERATGEDDPITILNFNWSQIYWWLAANIKEANPREILKAQIPILKLAPPAIIPIKIIPSKIPKPQPPENLPQPAQHDPDPQMPEEPAILIYHTHTSESYLPAGGKEHIYPKGDIVLVGKQLQQVLLEKYNVNSIHSEEVHDQIPFRESYQRSQATVKKYLAAYPSIKAVLDIHRDATPGLNARCTIDNQNTATICLVVGSDKMGLPHPQWKANYQFATRLAENMNLYYPGLHSRILVSDARYNQHLHDHALIVEVGDQNSTLEEAYRAVELLAGVLVITLNQKAPQEIHQP